GVDRSAGPVVEDVGEAERGECTAHAAGQGLARRAARAAQPALGDDDAQAAGLEREGAGDAGGAGAHDDSVRHVALLVVLLVFIALPSPRARRGAPIAPVCHPLRRVFLPVRGLSRRSAARRGERQTLPSLYLGSAQAEALGEL